MTEQSITTQFDDAVKRFGVKYLAENLGKSERTLKRWEQEGMPANNILTIGHALNDILKRPDLKGDHDFRFIDLFAGIGGIRTGFEKNNGKCVFTSEWNKYSVQTYEANFKDDHPIYGDITAMHDPQAEVPDHDVLLAGFPCQPFSIAGVSKKNSLGRSHGFACDAQGTLFFDVARIIDAKRPAAFLLENVKNLQSHDKGNTFRVIRHVLSEELGYDLHVKVIDGKGFVPQHRERIYMIGFREKRHFSWDEFHHPHAGAQTMKDILHSEDGSENPERDYTYGDKAKVNEKYTLSDKLWSYLQNYAEKHRLKGNGFGFGKVGPEDTARTLSARYYKDGSEILIDQGTRKRPRRLTPRECARLMGYDDTFVIPVSDTQSYKQFGNSVVVPVIEEIARIMKPHIKAIRQPFEATAVVQAQL
jgi:DNA (cytosine-5)-methyltransferase 1